MTAAAISAWSHVMRRAALAPATIAALSLTACASSAPIDYQQLSSASQLRPAKDDEKPFQYRTATANLRRYSALMIDPVTIYGGADAQFGSVSAEDRRIVADYMRRTFAAELGKSYRLVETPGPDTLRLRLTLTGIETSTPLLSTLSHLAPAGLVINTALEATDNNGTFFGSVSYAVELRDATSSDLLYAYVTKQTPDALDITASLGYLDAARTGVRIGARHLREDLAQDGSGAAIAQQSDATLGR